MHVRTARLGADARVRDALARGEELGGLEAPETLEVFNGSGVEGYCPVSGGGLRLLELEGGCAKGPAHGHLRPLLVEVRPPEGANLAPAESGEEHEAECDERRLGPGGVEHRPEPCGLLGCQRLLLVGVRRGRPEVIAGVAGD